MRLTTALVAATSVSSSVAFLVTTEISKVVNDKIDAFTAHATGTSLSIDVKCHECPLIVEYNQAGKEVQEGAYENPIHLDFSTVTGQLQVNNATIFPLEEVNTQMLSVHAYQTQPKTGKIGALVPVDYAISVKGMGDPDIDPASVLFLTYEIDVTILGLAGTPVMAQTARVTLIDWDGVYYMADVRGTQFKPNTPGHNDLEVCRTARNVQICRVRIMLLQKAREMAAAAHTRISSLKEWMKNHGPGNKVRPATGKSRPCPGAARPRLGYPAKFGHKGHQHGHGPHAHRHLGHKIWSAVRTFVNVLVIPALIGAVVGFSVGFIGMLVGQIISALWARYRQQQKPRYIVVDEEVEFIAGEKEGLLVESEAPPAYEYRDEVIIVAKPDEVSHE